MTRALTRARRGAALALVGAVLLANPAYVGLLVDEPRARSPTGYVAVPVDPSDATDQVTIIQSVGGDDLLHVAELAGADEASPRGDAYRAPGAALAVLRRAMASGTATTDDPAAAFTLRRVLARYRYVVRGERGTRQYYRARVADGGDGVTVSLSPVNRSTVARYLVYRDGVLYAALPDYQRETVRKVLSADASGYRPYNDDFEELTDAVLLKHGTYYVFESAVVSDDFGISTRDVVSVALSALGALALAGAVALTGLSYRTPPGGDGTDGEGDEPDHV